MVLLRPKTVQIFKEKILHILKVVNTIFVVVKKLLCLLDAKVSQIHVYFVYTLFTPSQPFLDYKLLFNTNQSNGQNFLKKQ